MRLRRRAAPPEGQQRAGTHYRAPTLGSRLGRPEDAPKWPSPLDTVAPATTATNGASRVNGASGATGVSGATGANGAGSPGPSTQSVLALDVLALVLVAALTLLVARGTGGPLRVVLAVCFFFGLPGWALVGGRQPSGPSVAAALVVAVSISVCAAAATVSLWLHRWGPTRVFYVLAALTSIALLDRIRRRAQRP